MISPLTGSLGPLASGRARFNVARLPKLAMWPRADLVAANDGDPVSVWSEGAGLNNNISASGAARATYRANVFGAQPALQFASTGSQYGTTLAPIGTRGFTAYFPVRVTDLTSNQMMLATLATAGTHNCLIGLGKPGNVNFGGLSPYIGIRNGGSGFGASFGAFTTDYASGAILTVKYNGGAPNDVTRWAAYYNNIPLTLVNVGIGGSGNTTTLSGQVGTDYLGGYLPEVIVQSVCSKPGQDSRVWPYLRNRYGFTGFSGSDPGEVLTFDNPFLHADGNSLTAGSPGTSDPATKNWAAVVRGMLGGPSAWGMANTGIPGQSTEDMITRAPTFVDPNNKSYYRQNVLVAWEGIGSLNAGDTPEQAHAAMVQYIAERRAVDPYLYVILCTTIAADLGVDWENKRQFLNNLYRADLCGANALFDAAALSAFQNFNDATYYYVIDRIHLNDNGQATFAAGIYPLILAAAA